MRYLDTRNEHTATRRTAFPLLERRGAVRTMLRDVVGRLTWRADAGEVVREVAVLNISGGGAALLGADAPPAGLAIRLDLHGGPAGRKSLDGEVVESNPEPAGGWVIRMRFAQWVALDWLRESRRERRLWVRYPAIASRATLIWLDGDDERTIPGDLLNISGGGAALVCDALPPPGIPVFLRIEAAAEAGLPIREVESRLIATSVTPTGMRVAHLQFVDPCPMELFERAVAGPGG